MKYTANYMTSNGTHMSDGIDGNNKLSLAKEIKEIAKGNKQDGDYVNWYVDDSAGNTVVCGTIR